MYSTDLAYIHDKGFTDLAADVAPSLIELLRRHGVRRGRVVDAGCGSGVLSHRLVEAGYEVVGIDTSPAMIRLARAQAPGARFRVASVAATRLPRCNAVIAIGEVVTYLPSRRALARFVASVRKALTPSGLFLFDFIESAERRTYPAKSRGGDDWAIVARADLGRGERVLTRRLTMFRKIGSRFRRSSEVHRVRIYGRDEIGAVLDAAGFSYTMRRSFGRYRLMAGDVAVLATAEQARSRRED